MRHFKPRVWLPTAGLFLAIIASAMLATVALAQSPDIMRVEEDWEMVIGEPSPTSDAPQVTCLISPLGNANSLHATFVVNHHDVPTFTAGGLQLQAWDGEELLSNQHWPNRAVLGTPGETIRWTQAMQVGPEGLTFEVVNGTSTTWGAFGGEGMLKAIVPTSLSNLNGYSPEVSVAQSGVSYAGNRVKSLVLKRVRVFGSSGLLTEDDSPRVVHPTTN